MADTESLGEAGVAWLEELAALPEPRAPRAHPHHHRSARPRLRQLQAPEADRRHGRPSRRARSRAFEALGVLMTNTCINYQTILPPVRGEHLAMGDTGVVIYSNSVHGRAQQLRGRAVGARRPGSPAARRATAIISTRIAPAPGISQLQHQPRDLADWGALGGIVGRATNSYWEVPVVTGLDGAPNSDELKHFGAALASFGSVALFHMPGVTPEAPTLRRRLPRPRRSRRPRRSARPTSTPSTRATPRSGDKVDVVVFAAPQLSLIEMQQVAGLLDGRRIHADTSLIVATSPEIKFAADRMGLTRAHRGCRRHRRRGRVLLPELCARDGGGQRLAAPAHQLGQARQHHRRLRLQADARQHGALHRQRGRREGSCDADRAQVPQGHRPGRHRHGAGGGRQFLRPLRSRPPQGHVLAARAQALRPELRRQDPGAA